MPPPDTGAETRKPIGASIEPVQKRILALKSSVHFRADFQPIAREILIVAAPGPARADPTTFPFRRLRHGLRLKPLGPQFTHY